MATLSFQVAAPTGQPYEVVFSKDGKNLTATCSCPAGADRSDICAHLVKILSGSTKEIVSRNTGDVKQVISWISGTDVGKAMQQFRECSKRLENATDDFNDARKRLFKSLHD